ncbi:Bug family tripartite tricarboxylate transporter substrate binding protein [Saccharomonospora cyanea]|uniref:Uncharacterized protein n=1 Tax=Saccharomonospora cyanea NA-134 TaxID=882082 RepID=H5XPJ5_9PSEU|nr:tripartite tricarboxylate transporter substrate binding protein [Saccharomonospora cyanea]EHR60042.1 hypothetical protein SaccyDRAFT_1131 [Saccharomonospora cyanea NA-134]
MRIRTTLALACAAVFAVGACSVQGGSGGEKGDYPSRAVEFTVSSSAGGATDLVTRALAKNLEEPLGTQIAVVNKPGANGKIAGKDVFGSEPDGYRVAVMPQSLFAVGPLVLDDPDAIQLDDMTFVAGLTVEDYVLTVPATSPVKKLDDLTALDSVKYGTTGAGTGSQLAQALLFGLAGTDATAVPFDGGGPLLNALLGEKVDAGGLQIAEAVEQVKAGKLRALAVFSPERLDAMPDVPTATELGYDVVVDQRRFVAAPAGLPDDVRDTLADAIGKAVESQDYNDVLADNYISRWDAKGDAVGEQLEKSRTRFADLVDELGIDLAGQS